MVYERYLGRIWDGYEKGKVDGKSIYSLGFISKIHVQTTCLTSVLDGERRQKATRACLATRRGERRGDRLFESRRQLIPKIKNI